MCQCVAFICYEVAPYCDSDSVGILFLGSVVDNDSCVSPCVACSFRNVYLLCVMTNTEFIPFWPVLSSPCAIQLKSFPNAVCLTLAVSGSFINHLKVDLVSPVVGCTIGDAKCATFWTNGMEFCGVKDVRGRKCLSHCHHVEYLLANQSCTCSCPSTQHSVGGNDNHC